jgi:Yip1 domain
MSPESVPTPEPSPAGMGEFARITGVFFEPGKTFQDVGERPRWIVPLLLTIAATLAFYFVYGQHIGWGQFVQRQMETNTRMQQQMSQMSPEQRERTQEMQTRFTGIGFYATAVVVTPIIYLISAAILLGVASGMMSAGLKFKQVFAIICYAGLPIIVKQALSIVVVFLKNPADFNVTNPLAFNPAAFMDPVNSSKFLYTIGTALDLFAIWTILLTAIGLKAAAGKRLSFGGALFAVAVPWLVLVLFGASMAALFS